MFGFLPINFRFRKKVSLILDIYHCMLEEKDKAMHPNQIAKKTGILSFLLLHSCASEIPIESASQIASGRFNGIF